MDIIKQKIDELLKEAGTLIERKHLLENNLIEINQHLIGIEHSVGVLNSILLESQQPAE